jgi:hypothetical protein
MPAENARHEENEKQPEQKDGGPPESKQDLTGHTLRENL